MLVEVGGMRVCTPLPSEDRYAIFVFVYERVADSEDSTYIKMAQRGESGL